MILNWYLKILRGVVMQANKLERGVSLKGHLRDSVRINRGLQHHLSRETLPQMDHYNVELSSMPTGPGRPTLEQLYLGEPVLTTPNSKVENVMIKVSNPSSFICSRIARIIQSLLKLAVKGVVSIRRIWDCV